MPTLTRPDNIPGPFAYNGDKNTIPDSGADAGAASWASGFPPVTQLPLNAGGIPPQRNDFNGAYNALSAHTFFLQSGSYYEWSAELMYPFAARVLGSDGKVYEWVSASGAGTAAGSKDPTTDSDHTYWQPAVTGSDLPEFDGVTIREINGKYGVPEFTPPTASAPGKAGLVPGPKAGQQEYYLSGDGNWRALTNGMPVGAIYMQLAGQSAPSDLFGGKWENISSTYAGLFFRAEGGSAATFGQQQTGGLPNITGWTKTGSLNFNNGASSGVLFNSSTTGTRHTGTDPNNVCQINIDASRSSALFGAANEVRPVNSTIRIWKRTA